MPVATNCRNTPTGIVLSAGVTAIDSRFAFVTVRLAETDCPLIEAVMTVFPATLPATASPLLLTLAIEALEEAQVTWLEIFCSVPLENFPVAVNCWSVYLAILALVGVSVRDVSDAGAIVNRVEAL